jgi:hypothetical protein
VSAGIVNAARHQRDQNKSLLMNPRFDLVAFNANALQKTVERSAPFLGAP